MNIEQTRTAIAELAAAGSGEARVFDSVTPTTLASRRYYHDQLMMGVVLQLSDLEESEYRQKRRSVVIAAVSVVGVILTSYVLFT